MSNASNAIRQKAEAALKAYLQSAIIAGTPLVGVDLKLREEITDLAFPRIVFDAVRAPEEAAVEGLYRVEVDIHLGTKAGEVVDGVTADQVHARRTGQLTEIFGYGNRATMLAALNVPESGPDQRAVKGILFYDLFIEEETGDIIDRVWISRCSYIAVCSLQNE